MMSMIYLKKPGGNVKIYDKSTVDNIINEDRGRCRLPPESDTQLQNEQVELKFQKNLKKRNLRTSSAPTSALRVSSLSQSTHSGKSQNWLNKQTIKELLASNECPAAKRLYTPFLETEATFVKELDDYLAHREFINLRKKELLHKQWTDKVYEPIRKRILDAVDELDWNSVTQRKQEMHGQFLEHVNKRGFVFLRDDDKEEYFAEALNAPVKIKIKALRDPLHVQSRQRTEEDYTILRCMSGNVYTDHDQQQVKLPPLCFIPRECCILRSCQRLDRPHYNIDNVSSGNNRHRAWRDAMKTNFDFSGWAQGGYNAKVIAQELQIPHKRMYAEHPPYGKPPVAIPHAPFIDPDDFADKIVNTNPFPQHIENLKAEAEALREFFQNQPFTEEPNEHNFFWQESRQQKMSDLTDTEKQLPTVDKHRQLTEENQEPSVESNQEQDTAEN